MKDSKAGGRPSAPPMNVWFNWLWLLRVLESLSKVFIIIPNDRSILCNITKEKLPSVAIWGQAQASLTFCYSSPRTEKSERSHGLSFARSTFHNPPNLCLRAVPAWRMPDRPKRPAPACRQETWTQRQWRLRLCAYYARLLQLCIFRAQGYDDDSANLWYLARISFLQILMSANSWLHRLRMAYR